MGLQRVRHDWVTELNWTEVKNEEVEKNKEDEKSEEEWGRWKKGRLTKIKEGNTTIP